MKEIFELDGSHVRILRESLNEYVFNYQGMENEGGMNDIIKAIGLFEFLAERGLKITLEKEL